MNLHTLMRNPKDPFWTTPIGWVGVGERRRPVFPQGGGAPEDDQGDSDTSGEGDTGGSDSDTPDSDAGGQDDAGDDVDKGDDELKKVRARMRAADKRAAALQKQLDAISDKDKSDSELATQRAEKAERELETIRTARRADRIQLAFHAVNDQKWHDLEDVLSAIATAEELEYDDKSGEVVGMKKAIAALVKKKPHWVKSEDSGSGRTGDTMNGRRKGDDGSTTDTAALMAKYPALRG